MPSVPASSHDAGPSCRADEAVRPAEEGSTAGRPLPLGVASIGGSDFTWGSALAVAALGAFGTGLAYVLMASNTGRYGGTRASTTTYLIPGVAVVLGIAFRGEAVEWLAMTGWRRFIWLVRQRITLRVLSKMTGCRQIRIWSFGGKPMMTAPMGRVSTAKGLMSGMSRIADPIRCKRRILGTTTTMTKMNLSSSGGMRWI